MGMIYRRSGIILIYFKSLKDDFDLLAGPPSAPIQDASPVVAPEPKVSAPSATLSPSEQPTQEKVPTPVKSAPVEMQNRLWILLEKELIFILFPQTPLNSQLVQWQSSKSLRFGTGHDTRFRTRGTRLGYTLNKSLELSADTRL